MPVASEAADTRKWADLVQRLGFPIAMCAVFISWEAGWLPSKTTETLAAVRAHQSDAAEMAKGIRLLAEEMRRSNNTMKALVCSGVREPNIQRICLE